MTEKKHIFVLIEGWRFFLHDSLSLFRHTLQKPFHVSFIAPTRHLCQDTARYDITCECVCKYIRAKRLYAGSLKEMGVPSKASLNAVILWALKWLNVM